MEWVVLAFSFKIVGDMIGIQFLARSNGPDGLRRIF